ncbi:hypothetical protein [Lysobacter niastensis]|uniref:Uncharacterized protein n=1 Tax=Lysobacter niastensis TaxID=380629 RepID=A0ABS0BAF9_9GAMM|nr:hypothetical protein [Lysobacter niastensis]MBF6025975.1 hypothetical protein [Lysobacter niastensis]
MLAAAGCDRDTALPDPQAIAVPAMTKPEPVQVASQDAVAEDRLEAGLSIMKDRVVEKQDAFAPIEVKHRSRYFLHPSAERRASITFDVSAIESLAIAPHIEDFSTVKDCAGNPAAGVVDVMWRLDKGPESKLTVDRHYAGTVGVTIDGASKLTIEVDQGNGVPWCDWLSVGVVDVKASQ